jgi:hypothetical protein
MVSTIPFREIICSLSELEKINAADEILAADNNMDGTATEYI